MEAGAGGMRPQAKDHRQPLEGPGTDSPSEPPGGNSPANMLVRRLLHSNRTLSTLLVLSHFGELWNPRVAMGTPNL